MKSMSKIKSKKGQAVIEYVLVTLFAVIVFSFLFGAMRESFFKLWVCDIGVRVAGPGGCVNTSDCWKTIDDQDNLRDDLENNGCQFN